MNYSPVPPHLTNHGVMFKWAGSNRDRSDFVENMSEVEEGFWPRRLRHCSKQQEVELLLSRSAG